MTTADYMDDAKDCVVRLSGNTNRGNSVGWTYRGELLLNGIPSGWRVMKVKGFDVE